MMSMVLMAISMCAIVSEISPVNGQRTVSVDACWFFGGLEAHGAIAIQLIREQVGQARRKQKSAVNVCGKPVE